MEKVSIEYQETKEVSVFGGKRIEVIYVMTHEKFGRKNKYRVTCELCGLPVANPTLNVYAAEFIGDFEKDSNDETLIESAAADLFEKHYIN